MEAKGKLIDITRNWENGKIQLKFEFEDNISSAIDAIKDKLLSITTKQYQKKRSLDANAYYWQLVTKLADCLSVSRPYLHNQMLRRHGQQEIIDGKLIYLFVPDNDAGERQMDEAETFHAEPTSEVKFDSNGVGYRTYIMLRGSSTYDTKEMSSLINGLVEDCKEQGIETLAPEELERMMNVYDQSRRKRHEETV